MVFAVKHDGRRKSRLVAGGHLTEVPTESVYSSVVSLRGVRIVIFLAELKIPSVVVNVPLHQFFGGSRTISCLVISDIDAMRQRKSAAASLVIESPIK